MTKEVISISIARTGDKLRVEFKDADGTLLFMAEERVRDGDTLTVNVGPEKQLVAANEGVDLNQLQTQDVLNNCAWELRPGKHTGFGDGVWDSDIYIQYKGKWLLLGRTDLVDDIRTTEHSPEIYERGMIEHYREKARYSFGARITEDSFYVVDALSDG